MTQVVTPDLGDLFLPLDIGGGENGCAVITGVLFCPFIIACVSSLDCAGGMYGLDRKADGFFLVVLAWVAFMANSVSAVSGSGKLSEEETEACGVSATATFGMLRTMSRALAVNCAVQE